METRTPQQNQKPSFPIHRFIDLPGPYKTKLADFLRLASLPRELAARLDRFQ